MAGGDEELVGFGSTLDRGCVGDRHCMGNGDRSWG